MSDSSTVPKRLRQATTASLAALLLAGLSGCASQNADEIRQWVETHYPQAKFRIDHGAMGPQALRISIEVQDAAAGKAAAKDILDHATTLPTYVCLSWPQGGGFSRITVGDDTREVKWEEAQKPLPAGAQERIISDHSSGYDLCEQPYGLEKLADGEPVPFYVFTTYVTDTPELVAKDPLADPEGWVVGSDLRASSDLQSVAVVEDIPTIIEVNASWYSHRLLWFDTNEEALAAYDRLEEGWEVKGENFLLPTGLVSPAQAVALSQVAGENFVVSRPADGTTITLNEDAELPALFEKVVSLGLPAPVQGYRDPNGKQRESRREHGGSEKRNDYVTLSDPSPEDRDNQYFAQVIALWEQAKAR
ncbi:MAG: hypothetical protein Q3999_04205 [Buchananella hordeovulneris]|nr:hypothetical protein [Buchananella hordeovulneris]